MPPSPQQTREQRPSDTVCTACRQRKIKCDRQRPACGFCSKAGVHCQYQSARQPPGLRAGYVSRLESRVAVLERSVEELKRHIIISGGDTDAASHSAQVEHSRSTCDEGRQVAAIAPQASSGGGSRAAAGNEAASFTISEQNLASYCAIWFEEYHSWFPILHEPTVLEACKQYAGQSDAPPSPLSLVIKAIAVVIAPTQPCPHHHSALDRQRWLSGLEDDVLLAAMHNLSPQSLQALLVLTISIFGTGRVTEFYNLIALCKRISTQLGLRDLVSHHCANFGVPSAIPPRMLSMPLTAVEREEKIRAFWTTEALDSISTLGAAWHLSISRPELAASVPCDEDVWRYPESVLAAYQFGNIDAPSSFSLFVSLATNELWHMHRFLQQSYDQNATMNLEQRQSDCDAVYRRLISWQADFERVLAVNTPPYVDLFSTGQGADQHPNTILIHCTIHSAVISLHQRFIFPADSTASEDGRQSWTGAADRCMASCHAMVVVIRAIRDATLEAVNPHVIFCVFIAARFYVIYARAAGLPAPEKLYLLIYALTVAGKRWPLAKQLKAVLDAAVLETRGEYVGDHPLPAEFYDLQYLSWDIHEALRRWAQAKDDTLTQHGISHTL